MVIDGIKVATCCEQWGHDIIKICGKVDIHGKVMCILCDSLINYGWTGVHTIIDHFKSAKKHVDRVKAKLFNFQIFLE